MSQEIQRPNAYIEVAHYPVGTRVEWNQQELLNAARKAVCRNTGWPMGVVLSRPDAAPKPTRDGIRAVIYSTVLGETFDMWSLNRKGYFYLVRTFEENSEQRAGRHAGEKLVFFDTRIWRVAEALVHCSKLYRELGLPPDTEIRIEVAHHGLHGRVLGASNPMRMMAWDRRSDENGSRWSKTVPLGSIEPNLEVLVGEVIHELFVLFEFWEPADQVWKGVLQEFLQSRV